MKTKRRYIVNLIASIFAIVCGIMFFCWRQSFNKEKRLLFQLRTLALAISVYKNEHGSFPDIFRFPPKYGLPLEFLQKIHYVKEYPKENIQYPPSFPKDGKVWFYYPRNNSKIWVCIDGAIGEGRIGSLQLNNPNKDQSTEPDKEPDSTNGDAKAEK